MKLKAEWLGPVGSEDPRLGADLAPIAGYLLCEITKREPDSIMVSDERGATHREFPGCTVTVEKHYDVWSFSEGQRSQVQPGAEPFHPRHSAKVLFIFETETSRDKDFMRMIRLLELLSLTDQGSCRGIDAFCAILKAFIDQGIHHLYAGEATVQTSEIYLSLQNLGACGEKRLYEILEGIDALHGENSRRMQLMFARFVWESLLKIIRLN